MAKYLRTTAEGQEQVVLDDNQVEAKSGFVSIGQIKLSPDQQMVAYTVDIADGSEAYETQVQSIAGAQLHHPFNACYCQFDMD